MHSQHAPHQSRIPEQQTVGETFPPVPIGINTQNTLPLPPGAMVNGTRLQVGKYLVIIHNFIAEGGFAHVYLACIEGRQGFVVLKRVAVPDTERLQTVEKEIAFMRRLGDHKHIVRYYESRIDPLATGGYEALILMEYCPGGGVIDLMNRRLQQRLTEPEILKIFSDVCEALAYMHYCNPPVLHRDLKVENILILSPNHYKLCDFGSAALSKGADVPKTLQDVQKLEEDIQRHTTLQYRAPEMIDIYQKKPINEKADIWALGVLLYKLCYYTTPFEDQGQLAILNAKYSFPEDSSFSQGIKTAMRNMLQEDQYRRPNIYQVMVAVSDLRGVPCPIRDIYQNHTPPDMSKVSQQSPPVIFEKLAKSSQQVPVITPMRRGRPRRDGNDGDSPTTQNSQESSPARTLDMANDSNSMPATKIKSQSGSNHSSVRPSVSSSPVGNSPKLRSSVSSNIEARFQAIKTSGLGSTTSYEESEKTDKSSSPVHSDSSSNKHPDEPLYWNLENRALDPISIPPILNRNGDTVKPRTTQKPETVLKPKRSTKDETSVREGPIAREEPRTREEPSAKKEQEHKEEPAQQVNLDQRPAPPPKPARFRLRTNAARPRRSSLSDFEEMFPSIEEIRKQLPTGGSAKN